MEEEGVKNWQNLAYVVYGCPFRFLFYFCDWVSQVLNLMGAIVYITIVLMAVTETLSGHFKAYGL